MRQRRTLAIVIIALAVAAAVLAIVLARGRDQRRASVATPTPAPSVGSGRAARTPKPDVPDPRTLAPASLGGTVREQGGGPLAGAQVCSSWWAEGLDPAQEFEPACATTGADGAYRLTVVPGTHNLVAEAPGHIPRAWRAPVGEDDSIELVAGQVKDGVDFVLATGGVEVKGVVSDINGGPIAEARVSVNTSGWWSSGSTSTKTDAQGRFALWAAPGSVTVRARAEGYAEGDAEAVAPAQAVEVLLTPESSLSGVVVEAGTKTPVADALVSVADDGEGMGMRWGAGASATTDAAGHFRIERLAPGRYKPTATGRGLYGETALSVLLGLGQRRDGVIIEVHPTQIVSGRVEIEEGGGRRPCPDGWVSLEDRVRDHDVSTGIDDGAVEAESVRPGTYQVSVSCEDHVAEESYPPVVVADADVTGLVWTVTVGGTIRGVVRTADGEPVAGVMVSANRAGAASFARRWSGDTTRDDGAFVITGLSPGDYKVDLQSDEHRGPTPPPTVTVRKGEEAKLDLVVAASGAIAGSVVEPDGTPVVGAEISLVDNDFSFRGRARSGEDGHFLLRGVEPGERRVQATRGWFDALRRPGTTDDDVQGERVKVVAGKTASVRLVVESRAGSLRGTVRDERGEPVGDAWVVVSRESDAAGALAGGAARATRWTWGNDDRPVVTDPSGGFVVRQLSPGAYTVRAYRRGGGEAVAEHVALGASVALVIASTGAIGGTVVAADGTPVDEFTIDVRDPKTGVARGEAFYRTGGAFTIADLAAGAFVVTATASGGRATQDVTLTAGERRTDLRLALEGLRTVRGRIVDLDSGAPVAGIMVRITARKGGSNSFSFGDTDGPRKEVSDADGRFEVADAPSGKASLSGFPIDFGNSDYDFVFKPIEVVGTGVSEVGDVPAIKRRVKRGEPAGDLGLSFVQMPPDLEPGQYELKVSRVRPGSPAAAVGITAGDVVVAVDGHDVRGERVAMGWTLMNVAVGAKLRLGLARGVTVEVTADAPP